MAVRAIREDMERAEARRLQPHFIADFFLAPSSSWAAVCGQPRVAHRKRRTSRHTWTTLFWQGKSAHVAAIALGPVVRTGIRALTRPEHQG